jgi:hypothetical protein
VTWTELEAATPLDEQWECIGTGTPFVYDGKLCLSYGLHTGRVYPDDRTTWPAQWDLLRRNGQTRVFSRNEIPGVPAGATYSVSADGVSKFRKTWITFHPCQNPSVYIAPDGRLCMLANAGSKGMWEAPSLDQGWRCTSPAFPPGGDCTFFFRWGKFDYIIGGFTDLWSKPADAPNTAYRDVAAQGLDFYDGLGVPAITEVPGGRFLMAGWLGIRGWGGVLVLRELMQSPDGRIGARWMKEATRRPGKAMCSGDRVADGEEVDTGGKPCMLTFQVAPRESGKGRLSVAFLGADGRAARELTLDLATRTGHLDRELKNLAGVDGPFAVRAVAKSDHKLGGTLLDVEIAGQRTAITFVENVTVTRLAFKVSGVEVRSLRVAALTAQRPPRRSGPKAGQQASAA